MAKPAPTKSAANALTAKIGPLPTWGWLAVAGAAVFFWMRATPGAKQAPADAGQGQQMLPYPTYQDYGQYGAQPNVFVLPSAQTTEQGASSATSVGNNGATTPVGLDLPHQSKLGPLGGYYPGADYSKPIPGYGGGSYIYVPSGAAADALPANTELYWEPQPGLFVQTPQPWTPGKGAGIAGPTALYIRNPDAN